MPDPDSRASYAHLPMVPVPKVLRTPQVIPFHFSTTRTTVSIYLSLDAVRAPPKPVTLSRKSSHNQFEMDIPMKVLEQIRKTSRQLNTLCASTITRTTWDGLAIPLIKNEHHRGPKSIVEGKVVRLGIQYHIASENTIFVSFLSQKPRLLRSSSASNL